MAVTATAALTIDSPLPNAFSRFIDFSTWDQWMPKGFRPISGPSRALCLGDRFTMELAPGVRSKLTVIRLRPNLEICWTGGIPGVLVGEHSFFFDDAQGKTELRSEEPFSGLLTKGFLGKAVEQSAGKVGALTLSNFAAFLAKQ